MNLHGLLNLIAKAMGPATLFLAAILGNSLAMNGSRRDMAAARG